MSEVIGGGSIIVSSNSSGGGSTPVDPNVPIFFTNVATTTALPACTYNNGVSGVGATLTANANAALASIDGIASYLSMVILVWTQSSQLQNGIYEVTQLGSGGTPWILTRVSIYNETAEIYPSQVNVLQGTLYANKYFLEKTANPVIGTSSIVYQTVPAPTSSVVIQNVKFVDVFTTTALPSCTYSSGVSPTQPAVGAALVASSVGVFPTLQAVSPFFQERVLVTGQADQKQNGDYLLMSIGSASTPWVLVRISTTAQQFYQSLWEVYLGKNKGTFFEQLTTNLATSSIGVTGNIVFSAVQQAQDLNPPVSGVSPLLYWDGDRISTDATPTHLGYEVATDTFHSGKIIISSSGTNTAKFTNTAASSPMGGSGMEGFCDDGAAMSSGDRLGFYTLGGAKDSSHTTSNSIAIEGFAAQTWSGTATGSMLKISLSPNGSTTRIEALRIDQDGSITFDAAYKFPTAAPSSGQVLGYASAGVLGWVTAGLSYFSDSQNTSTPNATIPVDALTALSSATDTDIAIIPKGGGAFLLSIPDNTATGGNKRGAYSVDLQRQRSGAGQVASGDNSVLLGGERNVASGTYSVAIGGYSCTASGTASVSGGNVCIASGDSSVALGLGCRATGYASVALGGGTTNLASGDYSIALGYGHTASSQGAVSIGVGNVVSGQRAVSLGSNCTSDGDYSFSGGADAYVNGLYGREARSSGMITIQGDSQISRFVLKNRTTDTTPTVLTSNAGAASGVNQVILSNNSYYSFTGQIIGKQTGTTNVASWNVSGAIVRGANAASTVLNIANVSVIENASGWGTPTLTSDTTNGGLKVTAIGLATTNIQWVCKIETTEVIY